jgi:transcription antitermination factor NusG
MLMADGRPQTCPSGAVEALLAAEDARRTPMTHGNAIAPGDAVTVIAGALGGHLGCIASIDDDTASVSIMLLGRLTNVRMPLDQIVPAGEMERWP